MTPARVQGIAQRAATRCQHASPRDGHAQASAPSPRPHPRRRMCASATRASSWASSRPTAARCARGGSEGVRVVHAVQGLPCLQRSRALLHLPSRASPLGVLLKSQPPSWITSLLVSNQTVDVYFEKRHAWIADGDKYVDKWRLVDSGQEKKLGFGVYVHVDVGRCVAGLAVVSRVAARAEADAAATHTHPPTPPHLAPCLRLPPARHERLQQARRVQQHRAHAAVARAACGRRGLREQGPARKRRAEVGGTQRARRRAEHPYPASSACRPSALPSCHLEPCLA